MAKRLLDHKIIFELEELGLHLELFIVFGDLLPLELVDDLLFYLGLWLAGRKELVGIGAFYLGEVFVSWFLFDGCS